MGRGVAEKGAHEHDGDAERGYKHDGDKGQSVKPVATVVTQAARKAACPTTVRLMSAGRLVIAAAALPRHPARFSSLQGAPPRAPRQRAASHAELPRSTGALARRPRTGTMGPGWRARDRRAGPP